MFGGTASARCSLCGINWPAGTFICRKCDGKTEYVYGEPPLDPEEIERIMSTTEAPTKMDAVEAWRFDQLLAHGLDLDRAQAGALDRNFDVQRFRSLRQRGCAAITAWEIVR